jgi:hypothetical protein
MTPEGRANGRRVTLLKQRTFAQRLTAQGLSAVGIGLGLLGVAIRIPNSHHAAKVGLVIVGGIICGLGVLALSTAQVLKVFGLGELLEDAVTGGVFLPRARQLYLLNGSIEMA